MTNPQTNRINNHFERVLVFVVSLLAAPVPAHASTTYTINSIGDLADINTGDGLCVASNGTCTAWTVTLRKVGALRKVAATVSYDPVNNKVTLNPKTSLAHGGAYLVTVGTGGG